MAIATYTLADYIQDLRTVTSETQDPNEIIARVGPLAERAALSRDWLKPQHYECDPEQGFGVHLLHEEADHTWQSLPLPGSPDAGPRHITMAPGRSSLGSMGWKPMSSGNALMMARALATRRSDATARNFLVRGKWWRFCPTKSTVS